MEYKLGCIVVNTYIIAITVLYRSVEMSCQTTEGDDGPPPSTKSVASLKLLPRAPPPPLYTMPPVPFEGVDYEDMRDHPRDRFEWIPPGYGPQQERFEARMRWWCWYEYIRCLRTSTFLHYICALWKHSYRHERYYYFINECEMDHVNCYIGNVTYWYVGDGLNCMWHKGYRFENMDKLIFD